MTTTGKMIKHQNPAAAFSVRLAHSATMLIDKVLSDKLHYFIQSAQPNECMWYSLIDRLSKPDDSNGILVYRVSDLFIPKQTIAEKEVNTFTNHSAAEMWQEVKTERNIGLTELSQLMKRGRMWGHSHVNMPPIPSGDDDKQWEEMKEGSKGDASLNPVAMLILNLKGEYTNRIYDPELKVEFSNVNLWINDGTDYAYIDEALKTKLVKKPAPPPKPVVNYMQKTTDYNHNNGTTSYPGNITFPKTNWPGSSEGGNSLTVDIQGPVSGSKPPRKTQASSPQAQQEASPEFYQAPMKKTTTRASTITSAADNTGASQWIKQFLPSNLLEGTKLGNTVQGLQQLVDKMIGSDAYKVKSVAVSILDDLNRCRTSQQGKIANLVDALITCLTPDKDLESITINRASTALMLLETAYNCADLSTVKVTEILTKNLSDFTPGSKVIIRDFFEREVIACDELFLFAFAIAKLERLPLKDSDQKAEFVQNYLDNFVELIKIIRQQSEREFSQEGQIV